MDVACSSIRGRWAAFSKQASTGVASVAGAELSHQQGPSCSRISFFHACCIICGIPAVLALHALLLWLWMSAALPAHALLCSDHSLRAPPVSTCVVTYGAPAPSSEHPHHPLICLLRLLRVRRFSILSNRLRHTFSTNSSCYAYPMSPSSTLE